MKSEYITLRELEEKFQNTLNYLEMARDFKNHVDKPWIAEITLARWLYEGSIQVIKNFKEDVKRLETPETYISEIQDMEHRLIRNLKISANKLIGYFPEDKLIQMVVQR